MLKIQEEFPESTHETHKKIYTFLTSIFKKDDCGSVELCRHCVGIVYVHYEGGGPPCMYCGTYATDHNGDPICYDCCSIKDNYICDECVSKKT